MTIMRLIAITFFNRLTALVKSNTFNKVAQCLICKLRGPGIKQGNGSPVIRGGRGPIFSDWKSASVAFIGFVYGHEKPVKAMKF